MKHIWSPWRMKFIEDNRENNERCIFCGLLNQSDGPDNLIVHRGNKTFVLLNRYPYTTGHVMVIPYVHSNSFEKLDSPTLTEMMLLSNVCMQVLGDLYHPHGFNLGANIGIAAGAGIADHVHMHVVPRWNGDGNFVSVVGSTRVIPEDLLNTYLKFSKKWDTLNNKIV